MADRTTGGGSLLAAVQRYHQPLALAAVAALAVLVFVPGLGRSGLWDPWEMDRAHVAREMAGPTKVMVVESLPAEARAAGAETGALAAVVAGDAGGRFRLIELPEGASRRSASRRQRLKALRAAIDREVVHLLVVELSTQVRALDDLAGMDELARSLLEIRGANPGMRIALATGSLSSDLSAVRRALAAAGARATLRSLQTHYGLLRGLPAPEAESLERQLAEDPDFLPEITLVVGPGDPALAELLDGVAGVQTSRAQFRADGELQSVPYLDYRLTAVAYTLLGFNETSARLPFLVWGLLGVLVVVLVTRKLFGFRAALLAGVALVTMPLYVGQARHVSGDISFGVTIAAAVGAFLVFAREERAWGWFALFLVAAVLAFLSNGLTALLVLWVTAAAYVFAAGDRRRPALIGLASLTVLFAGAIGLVLGPGEWTSFSQFKFMDRLFEGGPIRDVRTVDYLVRQVGFGLFPWSALLPFALGRLWWKSRDEEASGRGVAAAAHYHGVILWFAVPFVLLAVMLKDFSHCVFPAVPAVAVACGVLLDDLMSGDRARGFFAFAGFVLLLVLAKQLGTSPEPLTGFLTYDPHFTADSSNAFPETVELARPVRYLVLLGGLLLVVYGLKLGTIVRRGAALFRRPGPFWTALFALAGLLGLYLIASMTWKFDVSLSREEARALQPADRLVVRAVMGNVFAILIYVVNLVCLAFHFLVYTEGGRRLRERRPRFRFLGKIEEALPQRIFVAIAGLALVLGVTILFSWLVAAWSELSGVLYPGQEDTYARDLLAGRPVLVFFGVAALLVANRAIVAASPRFEIVFRALELFERPRPVVAAFVFAAAVFTVSTAHSLYPELALHVSQKHIVESYLRADGREELGDNIFKHGSFSRSGQSDANFYTNQIPEMADRATVVQALVQREDTIARLGARGTAAGSTVVLAGFSPCNDRDGDRRRDWSATAGLATGAGEGFLEDARAAWDPDQWKGHVLHHFVDVDVIGNTATRLRLKPKPLIGTAAGYRHYEIRGPLSLVPRAESCPLPVRGTASRIGSGFLEDATAQWEPDQWKGFRVRVGQSFPVNGNTATRLTIHGSPQLGTSAETRRYAVDHPEAAQASATAAVPGRHYFLLPKLSFSELNHAFRQVSGGPSVAVLDAASSRLILAASYLRAGEVDRNWITAALTDETTMRTFDWFPDSDGDTFHPVRASYDDKIEVIGWVMEQERLARRSVYRIKIFLRCLAAMHASYKIFMHVDRPGTSHRIHSDHWPLNLEKSPGDDPEKSCRGCFRTSHWLPGDIYVDSFEREVPLGTPSGSQDIWLGFYRPDAAQQPRLEVKDFDAATVRIHENRVHIGSFEVY